ncbi:hypothetical protein JR338_01435 [Chloroflexota bacterium]|nr:hypothetical protein JR338_01435 [Chloroflexota bacterium]
MKIKKMKPVIILLVISLLLTVIFVIRIFLGLTDLELEETVIDNGNASILIPNQWVGFDAREVYEKKISYEKHIIFVASNYGRFPRMIIYEVKNFDSEEEDIQLDKLIDWDNSRMADENNPNFILSILQSNIHSSGQFLNFRIDTNHPILAPTIYCRDLVTIQNGHGYIISICDRENRWDQIENIYSDIISSFSIRE